MRKKKKEQNKDKLDVDQFICPLCEEVFKGSEKMQDFLKHICLKHLIMCPVCKAVFEGKNKSENFLKHMLEQHSDSEEIKRGFKDLTVEIKL